MNETSQPPGSAPLNGWKDIASYLGRSVRAVQRWERELGLPVHRIRTAEGQTVYAFREEIDRWRATVDVQKVEQDHSGDALAESGDATAGTAAPPAAGVAARGRWRSLVWLGIAGAILLAIGAAANAYWSRTARPETIAKLHWNGNGLEALDSRGGVMWRQNFESTTAQAADGTSAHVTDLDGDQIPEVIVAVSFSGRPAQSVSDAVYALTNRGHVLWKHVPTDVIHCGDESFTGPWRAKVVSVEDGAGSHRVWIAFAHHTWRPAFVLAVDPKGTPSVRYVQAGWIFALAHWATPAGRLLAAGGLLNEFGRASLVLVDADGPTSASPSAQGAFQCGSASSAGVHRMFLFPRLETTAPRASYDFVVNMTIAGPDLQVKQDGQAIVRIGPDLQVRDYALTDSFFRVHQQGETAGFLSHSVEGCPFLTSTKDIVEWTPSSGWRDLPITPQPRFPPATPRR